MIRVVHIINSLGLGGAERFLCDLILHMDRTEFEPMVLCLYKGGELMDDLQRKGIQINVVGCSRKVRLENYYRVYRILQKMKPEIVHTHLLDSCWYGIPSAWAVGVKARIAHLQNCYWNLSLKLRVLDRFSFQFADHAIACSQAVKDFYCNRMWYPERKISVVHNAIDIRAFEGLPSKEEARRLLGLEDNAFIVTTVASLTPQKGHRYLLEAARKIVTELPNVRFLLVGDGKLRGEIEKLCEEWSLKKHVRLLGKRRDIPLILAASDVFVLPSLWEGFSIALLEASLAQLPVVASSVDGTKEIISDGVNGFLVPPKDSVKIAERVLELSKDKWLRQEMGINGRQIVIERFNINQSVQKIVNIYQQFLLNTL